MDAPIRTRIRARVLRRELTRSEVWLWVRIRGRNPKFRRQHPLGPFIIDFYCAAARLAVEIDGGVHRDVEQQDHDMARTAWLERQGVRLMRLQARDVERYPDAAAEKVLMRARELSA